MEIVAVSPAMRRAVEVAARVAAAPATTSLLIVGESGTGKDLIARYVHERGGGAGALVTIGCGALPDALLESELFGHEKGAFTGAAEARPGRLEAARGGTLVLDEVGALSPLAQAKLLRVLEERRFARLGGRREIDLRARIVALTNLDLGAAVVAGDFRRDLFFRINVVQIQLPSLREQPAAIGPLARVFARPARVSAAALRVIERHPFPGNARELRNVIEQARIVGDGRTIKLEDLPEAFRDAVDARRRPTLADIEEEYIREVLAETRGNKAAAARVLGISRKNLYERLRRMGEAG